MILQMGKHFMRTSVIAIFLAACTFAAASEVAPPASPAGILVELFTSELSSGGCVAATIGTLAASRGRAIDRAQRAC